jgi:hypothetical protein
MLFTLGIPSLVFCKTINTGLSADERYHLDLLILKCAFGTRTCVTPPASRRRLNRICAGTGAGMSIYFLKSKHTPVFAPKLPEK